MKTKLSPMMLMDEPSLCLSSDEQLVSDEPILRLQRNIFLSPSAELEIDHPEVIRLLYCEASENVLEGLYPMDVGSKFDSSIRPIPRAMECRVPLSRFFSNHAPECHKLAGLSAVNQLGSFSEADHPPTFYKKLIPSLLPEWIEKSRSMFLGCSGSSLLARLFSRLDKVRVGLFFIRWNCSVVCLAASLRPY